MLEIKDKATQFQKKPRNSNLELYRIIVMLLIVAHHYVVNSGLMPELEKAPLSSKSLFFYLFGMWGKTGINCFVMITGYFMCKSHITIRKFLKLLLQVEFYAVAINAIFALAGYQHYGIKDALMAICPIRSIADGFVSCFLVFYLFIPFLNVLTSHLDKKKHGYLAFLCLFTYTLMGTIHSFQVTMNYVSWFCVLYFIASYIRIYGFCTRLNTAKWGGITLLMIGLSILSVLYMAYKQSLGLPRWAYSYVSDSNTLLAVATAVSSFMFFKDLKMKHRKWINTIAASTFGVLLIHANSDTMRQWLWKDTLHNAEKYYTPGTCLYAVISVLCVFFICIIIDYIRIHTVEKWTFKVIDKYLSKHNLQ